MKKMIISLSFAITLIILMFNCNGKSSLDFEDVKFNTPEKVIEELGIKDFPQMYYKGNIPDAEFNGTFCWDCLVDFQFVESLSEFDKNRIVEFAKDKNDFRWVTEGLPAEGVAEYYNIRYGENDTISYNIVITMDKVYVAYRSGFYCPDFSDLLDSNDFHLMAERTFNEGLDSSTEYLINFRHPYSIYINRLKCDKDSDYKETTDSVFIVKKIYGADSDYLQAEYEVKINKHQNMAIIKWNEY